MAGSYADVPGPRMAWDRDCAATWTSNGITRVFTTAQKQLLNAESNDGNALITYRDGAGTLAILFPQPRTVSGWFLVIGAEGSLGGGGFFAQNVQFATSVDSSTGADGTWVSAGPTTQVAMLPSPNYRTLIRTVSASGVKAVRWTTSGNYDPQLHVAHLYGTTSATERLAFWHPTLDQEVSGSYFDFGNVPQSSSEVRTFRLKNVSTTKTATTITAVAAAPTDPSPSLLTQYLVTDSTGTTAALTSGSPLATLAPGAISGLYGIARNTASAAAVGPHTMRIVASASTWS